MVKGYINRVKKILELKAERLEHKYTKNLIEDGGKHIWGSNNCKKYHIIYNDK